MIHSFRKTKENDAQVGNPGLEEKQLTSSGSISVISGSNLSGLDMVKCLSVCRPIMT